LRLEWTIFKTSLHEIYCASARLSVNIPVQRVCNFRWAWTCTQIKKVNLDLSLRNFNSKSGSLVVQIFYILCILSTVLQSHVD